jgi:regulator of sirC expression with transglutaminase-like and TPR domain
MANYSDAQKIFELGLGQREEGINLANTTLLLAKCVEYPDLIVDEYLSRIEKMAAEIESRLGSDARNPNSLIDLINDYLFVEQGFHGNEDDYYDPRNSFLNEVIDRKTGIPITLSTLYIELAGRVGLTLGGVSFPGHFIVKFSELGDDILIDPFNRGRILSEGNCQDILNRMYAGRVQFKREMLAISTKKQILSRMLNNLKGIYVNSQNHQKALSVVELILQLNPDNYSEIRDRGLLYYKLECYSQALHDLECYLSLSPDAPDSEMLLNIVSRLRHLVKLIN